MSILRCLAYFFKKNHINIQLAGFVIFFYKTCSQIHDSFICFSVYLL